MKFKGEAEPGDLIHTGSTIDAKSWYVVIYDFATAKVCLRLSQITTARWFSDSQVYVNQWIWDKGLKEFSNGLWPKEDQMFQTKYFKYKKHAETYLTHARLKGFAIETQLPEKPKKKLRVIKLNN